MIIVGEVVRLEAEFKDKDGNLVSPSEVTVAVVNREGSTDHTATEESEGKFVYEYKTQTHGSHVFRFETTDGDGKEEDRFLVKKET